MERYFGYSFDGEFFMNRKIKTLERAFNIAGLVEEFDKILQTLKEIDNSVWFGIYNYYFNADCETEVGLGLTKDSYCIQVAIKGDITKYVNRIDRYNLQETLNELSSPVEILYFDNNKRFLASYGSSYNQNPLPKIKDVYKDLGIPSNKSVGIVIAKDLKEFREILEYQKMREINKDKTKSKSSNPIKTTIIEANFIPKDSPIFDIDQAYVDFIKLLWSMGDNFQVDGIGNNTILLRGKRTFPEMISTITCVLEYRNILEASFSQNNIEMAVLYVVSNPGSEDQEGYLVKIKLDPVRKNPKVTCIKTANMDNIEDILDIAEREKLNFGDR